MYTRVYPRGIDSFTMHLRKNASKTAQNRPPNKKLIAKSARFEKNLARASGNTFQISRKLEQFFEQFFEQFLMHRFWGRFLHCFLMHSAQNMQKARLNLE